LVAAEAAAAAVACRAASRDDAAGLHSAACAWERLRVRVRKNKGHSTKEKHDCEQKEEKTRENNRARVQSARFEYFFQ
jgi:hypothetical protein